MRGGIEITGLTSSSGVLTKRISLGPDGRLISDGSACVMGAGAARRLRLPSVGAFADLIGGLNHNEAIALGRLRSELPDEVEVTTARKLAEMDGGSGRGIISRTAGHIAYAEKQAAFALLDFDTKGMPPAVAGRLEQVGGFWEAIIAVLPEIGQTGHVIRRSTSSGISRGDTGESIKGSDGVHIFVLVEDGTDIERFLRVLHDRCWLHGLGWIMVGAGGQFLERSIVDRMVYAAERLVFEGAPILAAPLLQDAALRAPTACEGQPINTVSACRSLTLVEKAKLSDLKVFERNRLGNAAAKVRQEFLREHSAKIAARLGATPENARRSVERLCGGVLLPDIELPFDAEDMAGCTVGDVLADPDRFTDATLADPLEGVAYGRGKSKVMRRMDGSLWIHSFAHGHTIYELKYDAATIERKLREAVPGGTADLLIRLLIQADVAPDEEQALRDLVIKLSGVKARPLNEKIKTARAQTAKEHARAAKDHAQARRVDRRIKVPAPVPDAERLPVLAMLDEVLGGCDDALPPIRNLDGHPIEVRSRPPMLLHELSSSGSNQAEEPRSRLPPPALPLLTKHDRFSLAHEIERHLEFIVENESGDRPVALAGTFVDHFMAFRDSRLPKVGAIVTAPLVLADGALLAPTGLDRERKLVFQIEPALLPMLPNPAKCTPQTAAAALDYLCNKWLCDVATDFSGKCVLIALALTILERALLPERPAFFVTAGQRGGGKTTAMMMVVLAVTGKKPPAAAWSSSEEERRKAIFAYLGEGLAAMVWDNIPRGTTISCPTIEKVLTAESYSDRVLGQSATITVPSLTVMAFTGNNIGPKGDLASRSLQTRLEVDRIDPENRSFTHADPVAWTLEHRGTILRALYTILLANSQSRPETRVDPKTRFKMWWNLVGSAVEHAAQSLVEKQAGTGESYAKAIDFNTLFSAIESDDEEGATLAEVLEIIDRAWPEGKTFKAADIAKLISEPMQGEEADAQTLKEAFQAAGNGSTGSVTAKSIGRRLTVWAGTPILVNDETLMIERRSSSDQQKQKHALSFRIRRP